MPSPNVAEDHQTKNAMALVNKEAAVMIKDAEVEDRLGNVLYDLLNQEGRRRELSSNILKLAVKDSDEIIAKEIIKLF